MKKILLPHFEYRTEICVLIQHINYAGHLGNDSFLSLLHEARVRFLHHQKLLESNPQYGLVMIESKIQYLNEAFCGEKLDFYVYASPVKRCFCTFFYQIINQRTAREIARAYTDMAFIDIKTRKMVIPPQGYQSLSS